MAVNDTEVEYLKKNIDDVFLLTNGIIVCLMQCGFACLEAGSVRSKNATNIIMKNIFDIFISALFYWLIGYSLAYGKGNSFLGLTYWAGVGLPSESMAHWFFQFVFAATAATIVSGAVAERCNFIAYITYSGVISGFIYPIVSHWIWSEEGWLNEIGYRDFAGSGAVHLLGGTCSLIGAVLLGPRIGRFGYKMSKVNGKLLDDEITGHSTPLVGIGGMILIAGFLAFNGGSLGTMVGPKNGDVIATVISNTVLGGSGGGLLILICSKLGMFGSPVWSFANTLNAIFAGMVSVCGAANEFSLWASFVSGCISGLVFVAIHFAVLRAKVDDPLDAVAVHFGGGFWGLISASIFSHSGLVYGATYSASMLLVYRLIGALAIIAWSTVTCLIMFTILKFLKVFRVTAEQELEGLDIAMHGEPAYPPSGWDTHLISERSMKESFRKIGNSSNSHQYYNEAYVITEHE